MPNLARSILVGVVLVILVGAGVYLFTTDKLYAPGKNTGTTTAQTEENHYTNEEYGISFGYPTGFVLQEAERGTAAEKHLAIVLVRQEDTAPRQNSEGPVAVTVDVYGNAGGVLTSWLKNSAASNFKLSDGTYSSSTVGGKEGVTYHWSGLYEADTTALLHANSIVAITATYITPQDTTLDAYREVLRSLLLTDPRPASGA